MKSILAPAVLAALSLAAVPARSAEPAPAKAGCAPMGGLNFVCGPKHAEDLQVLPGGRWLIASGMAEGGGLHLVDVRTKAWRRWIAPAGAKPDARFPGCTAPPDPERFSAQGLSLHPRAGGGARLYVVGHGARESIEVFDIAAGAEPSLAWAGCVLMPDKLVANSVAATPDGAIYATVMLLPGKTMADSLAGKPTGTVLEWRPGQDGFHAIKGTELATDNGIEASADGKTLYVVSSGGRSVTAFDRASWRKLGSAQISGFTPDNVHWGPGGKLYAAGMTDDEPACGGPPHLVNGRVDLTGCPRGYQVATIDPKTMKAKLLVKGPAVPVYTGTATALPAGGNLWISSFATDRIAYRPAP